MNDGSGKIISNREGDIAIVICQNNDEKTLIIKSADDPNNILENTVLYSSEELVGKDIRDLLTAQIKQNIDDYLEFEDIGNDLSAVLSKSRSFSIIDKSDNPIEFNMRIQRDASPDKHTYFIMVMQSSKATGKKNTRVLEVLKENQIQDKTTKLAEKSWFEEESDIVHFYVSREKIVASFAVITIDDYKKFISNYGDKLSEILLKTIAGQCETAFRSTDILGYLGDGKFGVILIGADSNNSQIPLNRLRWETANHPLQINESTKTSATVSIAYKEIKNSDNSDQSLEQCVDILSKNESKKNQILAA